jgi:hypothetical protein
MTRRPHPSQAHIVAFQGEVWTDGRGFATVRLPAEASPLEPPLDYELSDLEPATSARVTAELDHEGFTIQSQEPHVKVAWRLTGRRGAGESAGDSGC